jgi:hypothetical protein
MKIEILKQYQSPELLDVFLISILGINEFSGKKYMMNLKGMENRTVTTHHF